MKTAVLFTVGTRGDVEPCVAMAHGLRQAGLHVRVVTLAPFADLVRSHGIEFHSLGELPPRFQPPKPGESKRQFDFRGVTGRALFWSFFVRLLSHYLEQFIEGAAGADVILHSRLTFPAFHVAEMLRVPCWLALPVPHTPTSAFGNPYYDYERLRSGRVNRLSHHLEAQLMAQLAGSTMNRWRQARLGLPALPRHHLRAHQERGTAGVLYGISPHLLPRPADWPEHVHLTGHWTAPSLSQWTPPPGLQAFLQAGEPPICIGFGSMNDGQPVQTTQLVREALARVGRRGLLVTGAGALAPVETDEQVMAIDAAPHDWLLPQVAAVVHHGGAGTVAAAARAGVPQVLAPFMYDQSFWARRVQALGIGVAAGPKRQLRVANLADALHKVTADASVRARAADVAARMREEDGVAQAVAIVLGQASGGTARHPRTSGS
jgi:sterol 3beta-glucosyltransferase